MKKICCWFLFTTLVIACNNNKKDSETVQDASLLFEKLLGSFVGSFGDNKITLLITKAERDKVEGHTIVAGNDRPFSGSIKESGGRFTILANEPGNDPNDGTFDFTIDTTKPDVVVGSWKAFDAKKGSKYYMLQRKTFAYSADVGAYPEASQRELTAEDVENLMKPDLELMRNEIFARHGYSFKNKDVRSLFDGEDWYVPNKVDVKKELTPIERKNIEMIRRYEKYAQDYGDEFGR